MCADTRPPRESLRYTVTGTDDGWCRNLKTSRGHYRGHLIWHSDTLSHTLPFNLSLRDDSRKEDDSEEGRLEQRKHLKSCPWQGTPTTRRHRTQVTYCSAVLSYYSVGGSLNRNRHYGARFPRHGSVGKDRRGRDNRRPVQMPVPPSPRLH